jgi:hypothetical protein
MIQGVDHNLHHHRMQLNAVLGIFYQNNKIRTCIFANPVCVLQGSSNYVEDELHDNIQNMPQVFFHAEIRWINLVDFSASIRKYVCLS